MQFARLQSAMEYLMTYGWSILLIAIVIAAVYELGVFNNNPLASSNTCLPQPGFLCTKPVLNSTGILNITFGQSYGTTYTIIGVSCTNSSSTPSSFIPISPLRLNTGSSTKVNFNCQLSSGAIGTPFAGTLWIRYNTTALGSQTAKIAIVNLKVVTSSPQGGTGSGAQSLYPSLLSVPISLVNQQSNSTGNNFQAMLSINSNQYSSYINSGWSNVEFTTGNVAAGNVGTILQAWVESGAVNTATNTIVWINLPNGIPASSIMTIYLDALTGNVMSASGPTGEAPQLSSSYAQYDNGASVFTTLYQDFKGTSTPSGWTLSGPDMLINNGISITANSATISEFLETSTSYSLAANQVNDIYGKVLTNSGTGGSYSYITSGFGSSGTVVVGFAFSRSATVPQNWINGVGGVIGGSGGSLTSSAGGNYVFTTYVPSISTAAYQINYGAVNTITVSGSVSTNTLPVGLFISNGATAILAQGPFYWTRLRSYPPNGVAPIQNTGIAAPSGIIHYVPITLTNSQSSATLNNFQANIILNAGAYQSYESSNLQNIEFFYANGTIVPSWMEGNYLNGGQTTNLYTSNTIAYWLNIAPQIAASSGTQVVYAGFATTSTNLFNAQKTGEAPWLSGTYAQYDDGGSVFTYYLNMTSNPISYSYQGIGGWTINSISNGPFGINQKLLQYGPTGGFLENATTRPSASNFPSSFAITMFVYPTSGGPYFGIGASTTSANTIGYANSDGFGGFFELKKLPDGDYHNNLAATADFGVSGSWLTTEFVYRSGGSMSAYAAYGTNTLDISSAANTVSATDTTYTSFNSILINQYLGNVNIIAQYSLIVLRTYPPNGVPPSVSFGSLT